MSFTSDLGGLSNSRTSATNETANYASYPQRLIGRVASFSLRSDVNATLPRSDTGNWKNEPTYFSSAGASTSAGTRANLNGLTDEYSARRRALLENCRKQYLRIASSEHIEYGYSSASEQLLGSFAEKYPELFGDIVQHIFMAESKNAKVLVSLLKAVATFDYHRVYPYAQTMAIASLSNALPDVREAGIRAFESWEHPEGIQALESVAIPWPWLDSYCRQTIEYLKEFQ